MTSSGRHWIHPSGGVAHWIRSNASCSAKAEVQPLLVVFEDLHWIDSETQSVLDELVESVPTARLLLLVNYRPEYQHTWATRTNYGQLVLDPLPAEGAERLLTALLGANAGLEELTRMLIARTEGNPFFLE